MHEFTEALTNAVTWLGETLPLLGVALVFLIACIVYFRSRKNIIFEAWVNMTEEDKSQVGRRVADLLLFKLRFVKRIHEQGSRKLETWQPNREMPAFRQTLDEDIQLLGSVELGKYGSVVSMIVMFVLKLVPMMFRPARLRGSIHSYGKQLRLLATLEQAGGENRQSGSVNLWEVVRTQDSDELLAETVEELAYRIYLDLSSDGLFKSWEAFRDYTNGMARYVSWIDLERDNDFVEAGKLYRAALKLEPKNPAIKYNLALLLYFHWTAKDNEEALTLFQGALNAPDLSLKARALSGLASAQAMKFCRYNIQDPRLLQDAIMHGHSAITIGPEIDGAHKAYALACHQWSEHLGRTGGPAAEIEAHRQLAISHYQRAIALNPRHYGAHNNLGNLYLEWGMTLAGDARSEKFRMAKAEFESSLRIHPAYHHASDNLGNTCYQEGRDATQPAGRKSRYAEAAQAFRNALQYEPTYPEATNDLAMLHLEPEHEPSSPAQALNLHLQALRHIADDVPHRQKLCRQFTNRLAATAGQRKSAIEPSAIATKEIEALGCTCGLGKSHAIESP